MWRLAKTVGELVGHLVVLAPVAAEARDNEILRPVASASGERNHVVGFPVVAQFLVTPVTASALTFELSPDISSRMSAGDSSNPSPSEAGVRLAGFWISRVVLARKFADVFRVLGKPLRHEVTPLSGKPLVVVNPILAHVRIAFLAVLHRSTLRLGVASFRVTPIRLSRASVLAFLAGCDESVQATLIRVEEFSAAREDLKTACADLEWGAKASGTISLHREPPVPHATPPAVSAARGHSVRSPFYHVPVTT